MSNDEIPSTLIATLLYSCKSLTSRPSEVGITGKYGVRYGASLRKQLKRLEVAQHARYTWYVAYLRTTRKFWRHYTKIRTAPPAVATLSAATPLVSGTAPAARRPSPVVPTLLREFDPMPNIHEQPADFVPGTPAASAARSTLRRLREINE